MHIYEYTPQIKGGIKHGALPGRLGVGNGWAVQAAMFSAKCNAEVKTCINRCKGGNKVFIGVSRGLAYPISECK